MTMKATEHTTINDKSKTLDLKDITLEKKNGQYTGLHTFKGGSE